MPLDYSIDPANRLVVVRGADSVTGEPHIFDRIVQDPRFERGFNFIRDRRELTEPPESDDIRQAVAIMKAVAPRMAPCRWAVVVPAENLVFYGMARMASLLMTLVSSLARSSATTRRWTGQWVAGPPSEPAYVTGAAVRRCLRPCSAAHFDAPTGNSETHRIQGNSNRAISGAKGRGGIQQTPPHSTTLNIRRATAYLRKYSSFKCFAIASAIDCRFFDPRPLFTEYDHTICPPFTNCTETLALSSDPAQ
jgi:hypothetical protein